MNLGVQPIAVDKGDSAAENGPARLGRWMLLVALALATIAYIGALRFQFVYDDGVQVLANPRIQDFRLLPSYFTEHVWSHLTPNSPGNYYRPVFMAWLLLNWKLFGANPAGWHALVLLVHLAVTGMVYALALRLTRDNVAAGFAALIFAVHPIHVEAVAWVSGITEPLMALLMIAALFCWFRWREAHGRAWMAASLLLFAASALVKETAIVLPAIVGCYAWWDECGRPAERVRPAVVASLPFAAVTLAYLLVRKVVLKGIAPLHNNNVGALSMVASWPAALVFYLKKLVWPAGLSPFYGLQFVAHLGFLNFFLPLLLLVAVTGGLWWWYRREAAVGIAVVWMVVPLAPAIIGMIGFERGELVHDRYLYVPSIGFASLAALALRHLRSGERRLFGLPAAQALAAVLIVAGMAATTAAYTPAWASNVQLYRRAVDIAPNSVDANAHLANELYRRGRRDAALDLYARAVAADPDDWRAQFALGMTLTDMRRWVEAEPHILKTTELKPDEPTAFFLLGLVQGSEDKFSAAAGSFRRALALAPQMPRAHFGLGTMLEKDGKLAEARDEYRRELSVAPAPDVQEKIAELDRKLAGVQKE